MLSTTRNPELYSFRVPEGRTAGGRLVAKGSFLPFPFVPLFPHAFSSRRIPRWCVPEVHTRELEEENRRLGVSLSAREEDILESDRQMQALSARLREEVRVSGEAAATAEAVVGELRKALEEATGAAAVAGGSGDADENVASPGGAAAGADGESGEGSTDRCAGFSHRIPSMTCVFAREVTGVFQTRS